ncbi:MAG: D-2-hydroxyacid dehydrogenase [Firmicutes bacterium]|nr:D-2-hydroxyacid dehydrogenase [Bacillota bacterium]
MFKEGQQDALTILIIQEEAKRYAVMIEEAFPGEVKSGKIKLIPCAEESEIPEDVSNINIIGTWPLIRRIPEMKKLKWVMTFSSGIDHWEKSNLLPREIPLVHLPGGSGIPVAEFVIGLMLNHVKYYTKIWDNQKEHRYERIQGRELWGKTLGIIGLGGIGRQVAKRAKAFDMHVIGADVQIVDLPYVDKVYLSEDFEEILKVSDFVVLSCPETPETINMMNEERFKMMKPTAYFINCARGSLVVKDALIKALNEGWIAGASIDTHWIKNPLPSYLPSDDPLWDAKNVFISPHISSWTDMYTPRFGAVFVENIRRYLKGEPLINVAPGFGAKKQVDG